MKQIKQDILNGPIYKQILLLFYPILFGTFFQQLYNTVDAIIVGNYVGKIALGAVGGSTGTLINLLVGFITGLSSGATVVVAQYYGKRDPYSVNNSVKTGMFLAILLGAVMMFIGIVLAPSLLTLTNVPDSMYTYALQYMRIYFAGLIPSMIYNMGAGVLRAIGDSKRPLYFLIVGCFTNIILDILFVRVFNMAVAGAALATIISQLVSCILTLISLKHTDDCYHYVLKDTAFEKNLLIMILTIGLPTGLQSVMYTVSNIFIQSTVNGFGENTIAAWTAFGKIDAIFWMFSPAVGTACMTVAGQNFGAGKMNRVKKTVFQGILIHLFGTAIISSCCYFFGEYALRLFTSDSDVINIGFTILRYLAPTWLTFVLVEIMSSCIRACGDSLVPMIFTAVCICGFRIVYLIVVSTNTILEVLKCYPLSWIIASVVFLIYYLSGLWLKICLKKKSVNQREQSALD